MRISRVGVVFRYLWSLLIPFDTMVGLVPEPWENEDVPEDDYELGNGDVPPQWGIDFVVFSGTMTYGPWADRQRYVPPALGSV